MGDKLIYMSWFIFVQTHKYGGRDMKKESLAREVVGSSEYMMKDRTVNMKNKKALYDIIMSASIHKSHLEWWSKM